MSCSAGLFLSLQDGDVDAVRNVIVDVYITWSKASAPTVEARSIIPMPDNLLQTYRNISHNKYQGSTLVAKGTFLESLINQVSDIAYYQAIKLLEIEENSVLNRSEKGKNIGVGMGIGQDI